MWRSKQTNFVPGFEKGRKITSSEKGESKIRGFLGVRKRKAHIAQITAWGGGLEKRGRLFC